MYSTDMIWFPFAVTLLIRLPLYFPTYDDLSYHLLAGLYAPLLFTRTDYLPLDMYTYAFPGLHVIFAPLLYFIGLRVTNILLFALITLWALSLVSRYARQFASQLSPWLVKAGLLLLFFLPPLTATYMTFMVDVWVLLMCLEGYLQMTLAKSRPFGMALLLLAMMIKPASGVFIAPYVIARFYKYKKCMLSPVVVATFVLTFSFLLFTWIKTGNPTPGLFNKFFQSPLYPLNNFSDKRWGPIGIGQQLLWPAVGPWTVRFDELLPPVYSRFYSSIFGLFLYLGSVFLVINKPKMHTFMLYGGYLIWSLTSGYSRYAFPLYGLTLVTLYSNIRYSHISQFAGKTLFILAILVSLSSFKSDFAWRPYPSLKNRESTKFFLTSYRDGLHYLWKDRLHNLISKNRNYYQDYDAVIRIGKGAAVFVAGIGRLSGLPVVDVDSIRSMQTIFVVAETSSSLDGIMGILSNWSCSSPPLELRLSPFQNLSSRDYYILRCIKSSVDI